MLDGNDPIRIGTDIIERKNQELSTILQVSRVLTRSFDLEENLLAVMETLATQLDMQRGCVFLLDEVSREVKIVAAYGLSPQEVRRGTYRIGEGIVGRVIEGGRPMFIPNIGDEPKFLNKTHSRPKKSGISFFCLPIMLDGKVLGVLSADRIYTDEHGNVEDDLRVLDIVSKFIAQFVKLWGHFKKTEVECGKLRSQLMEKYSLPNIVGESVQLQQVLKSVRKVAETNTTVLLLGESGTGKELIARTLHYESRRANQPFVPVNLAALPENLIEVELFGVEKGAYTGATARRLGRFETADGGTLFLDEVGELPPLLQVKLLRVLQERSFERIGSSQPIRSNVRIVAATNRNLLEEVEKGNFREDLYWRLHVVPIMLPALRERNSDIPLLLNFYLNKFNRIYSKRVCFTDDALQRLTVYAWPGNVRELANTVERMVIMSELDCITANDLPSNLGMPETSSNRSASHASLPDDDLSSQVEELERRKIVHALKKNNFVQQRASKTLGITPRQLGYRIKKYGINPRSI